MKSCTAVDQVMFASREVRRSSTVLGVSAHWTAQVNSSRNCAVCCSCLHRWFDRDENSSGQLGSSLSTDAAVIRGAVGDVFGVTFQNLACMAAGEEEAAFVPR